MMWELVKAIILGIIQGVSEFLPISSTGHLIIAEHFLGISQKTFGLAFDAVLHLGTLTAIIWYFRAEFGKLATTLYRYIVVKEREKLSEIHLLKLVFIATIPAIIIGLALENIIENVFRSPSLVGLMLLIFTTTLVYVEKFGQQTKDLSELNKIDSLIIGVAQAIALIPGVSRSGITIAGGMLRKLKRDEAARFAFVLSAPVVAGAGGKQFLSLFNMFSNQQIELSVLIFFLTGMISAAIFGYLTIKYFLKYISTHSLYPFVIYRVVAGLVILLF